MILPDNMKFETVFVILSGTAPSPKTSSCTKTHHSGIKLGFTLYCNYIDRKNKLVVFTYL